MSAFWIATALLLAGALLFLLPPLLRGQPRKAVGSHDEVNIAIHRDQLRELEQDLATGAISPKHYAQARIEIEKRLLEDVGGASSPQTHAAGGRGLAVTLAFALPAAAVGLYLIVGNPAGLDSQRAAAEANRQVTPEQIAAMVNRLAARLKDNPDDVEGWVMLARSYTVLERHQDAAVALAQALARTPDNAQLLADYADALAMAQARSLAGEPERVIARALEADPRNIKALALAGTAAFERKDYAKAMEHWGKLLELVPPESEFAQTVRDRVAETRSLSAAPASPAAPIAAADNVTISGTVELAPPLAARVEPNDTVFVFARPAAGSRMPLAVLRKQAKDLPLQFVLDDSMAMAPNAKLSAAAQVVVAARISKSGSASPQPGDLEGLSAPVNVGASEVRVTIDAEVE